MKGLVGVLVTLILLLMGPSDVEMIPDAMKQLTQGFLKVLDQCKLELGLTDGIITDLYHLWREEYDQISKDAGCVLLCMSKKLDLFGDDGKIHHGNMKEYAVKNGAGEEIADQLLKLAHECEKQNEAISDECERTLEVAKCLRKDVKKIDWTAKMEVIITEVIEA